MDRGADHDDRRKRQMGEAPGARPQSQPAAQGRGQTKRDAESAAAGALLDQLNKGN